MNEIYREEAKKWEALYDEVYDALSNEVDRDSQGELETVGQCAKRIIKERNALLLWKKQMLYVESTWDEQAIGGILDIGLGESVRSNIESKIHLLIKERDELIAELKEYRSIAENVGAKKAVSEKEKAIRERDEAREALRDILKTSEPTPVLTYQKMEDIASKALKDKTK